MNVTKFHVGDKVRLLVKTSRLQSDLTVYNDQYWIIDDIEDEYIWVYPESYESDIVEHLYGVFEEDIEAIHGDIESTNESEPVKCTQIPYVVEKITKVELTSVDVEDIIEQHFLEKYGEHVKYTAVSSATIYLQ